MIIDSYNVGVNDIYLDTCATTYIQKEVLEEIFEVMEYNYGNPSSIHPIGFKAKQKLNESRKIIADSLMALPEEIIFTSGGTEANNLIIKGFAFENKHKGNHIITSKIEHDCILNSTKFLEKNGFEVTYLDVDENGFINLKNLEENIRDETILISIIHANNEIGTIQNVQKIYEICKAKKILFHTDACQSFTKIKVNSSIADAITINAHKIYGPKGIGALYLKKKFKIEAIIDGGGQEAEKRSGTENVPLIAGFAKAVEFSKKIDFIKIAKLRNYLIDEILKIDGAKINGPTDNLDCKKRIHNNVSVSFKSIEGESILSLLSLHKIYVSTGSACSSNKLDPSHVIMAISNDIERAHGSIRISLGKDTTKENIDFLIAKLKTSVKKLRDISPIYKNV